MSHAPLVCRIPRALKLFPLLVASLLAMPAFADSHDAATVGPTHSREELSGGDGTVFDVSRNAFGRPLPTMSRLLWNPFRQGKQLFTLHHTIDAEGRGLGPLYNAVACSSCHFKDGRAGQADREPPLLVRLSVAQPDGLSLPEPVYGGQLQSLAVQGRAAEGSLDVIYAEVPGTYADGQPFALRRPHYELTDLGYGPLHADVESSARMPPALVGLGLLEAIPEAALLANADPDDRDGDGISGRANRVPDLSRGDTAIGRFGWKAGQPSLRQQNATALREDLGLSHPVLEGSSAQGAATHGSAEYELSRHQVERLTLYTRLLAVPARRQWQEPEVVRGKALFSAIGCQGCHHPRFETGEVADLPALSHQVIRPYSDLLLHDMGPELADGRPEHLASGREWRTAPLWGLGLLSTVSGEIRLLHDGRARSVEEAILWHGGESQVSRDRFAALPYTERQALLGFINSL